MANLRYAPEFRLLINDTTVPAALRASISSVNYQTGLEGSDRVELAVVNENLRWLDDPLLALDKKLTLSLGYAPDPLEQVFVGEIVGHSAAFPSSGVPTLTVAAQDRLHRLQKGRRVRWFANPVPTVGNFARPDSTVLDSISGENDLIAVQEPVGATLAALLGNAQAVVASGDPDAAQKVIRKQDDETDFDFLTRIARENGWEMLIDHAGPQGGYRLRFLSPSNRLDPEITLKYGQSLVDFTPHITNVGQLAAVTTYVWVPFLKSTVTVSVGWDWKQMALTIDVRTEPGAPDKGPAAHLIEEPVTPVSAWRKIIQELVPRLNRRLTASGSTIGDPRLRAGTLLRLEGLGVQFGGLYRVTSATHTIDSGGYQTGFEVRKEFWFSNKPPEEQGAVPVRTSPALAF